MVERFWLPSGRVTSTPNGVWAPAVLPTVAAEKPGSKGRGDPGQGLWFGPESREKNWLEVWLGRAESHGSNVLVTA
jgi:hypothetical protein